ncbi:hypothetical protein [Chelativorans alearense]|uniref:hypothetical protein n=1 Tax=Chelativorans alearense TaxID=2681495 RepID=UPI001969E6E0|nr:hypothetical protein [Chelativorans alearense]
MPPLLAICPPAPAKHAAEESNSDGPAIPRAPTEAEVNQEAGHGGTEVLENGDTRVGDMILTPEQQAAFYPTETEVNQEAGHGGTEVLENGDTRVGDMILTPEQQAAFYPTETEANQEAGHGGTEALENGDTRIGDMILTPEQYAMHQSAEEPGDNGTTEAPPQPEHASEVEAGEGHGASGLTGHSVVDAQTWFGIFHDGESGAEMSFSVSIHTITDVTPFADVSALGIEVSGFSIA